MRVLDHLAPVLARDEARDQVHRARAIERVERDQVLQPRRRASRSMPCMPRLSNWNTASVRPSENSL